MIADETEYRATQIAARRFEEALAHVADHAPQRHPLIQQAMREQLQGELAALRAQIAEYEARTASPAPGSRSG
jgi:hypothetical protein